MIDYSGFSKKIHYIKIGSAYTLTEGYQTQTDFRPESDIVTEFVILLTDGTLVLFKGFCFDGVSGPVIDRKTNMRAGAGHDGLYRLMRKKLLSHKLWRDADKEFAKWLKEDKAWKITIRIDMAGLKMARGKAAHPKNRLKVYVAG